MNKFKTLLKAALSTIKIGTTTTMTMTIDEDDYNI